MAEENPVDPPIGEGEPEPPLSMTANEALEQLKTGDTSCLEAMAADEVKAVRPMFKEWANGEEVRIKAEYARVYNDILVDMNRKGLVY